ncbi:MAG: GNAT family N-acetyltransferase [Candidatus Brocadiae bacterium]|nr:GNAT family N-acetyltransferase [Candidatus Brocadiia bacterium]
MIEYTDTSDAITPGMLQGFFVGWKRPHDPETHLKILANSGVKIVAVDPDEHRVVGFAVALTDHVQQAFIYLLEVLPEYQNQGIGTGLMRRILEKLRGIPCIDLTCYPALQPFYSRFGMQPSVGMVIRDY